MFNIYRVPSGYMVKGEYEILNKIAESGSGAVYMAQKGPLKTKYAVKFVDLSKNPKDREVYMREILLMKDIDHPNISKIVDHEDHDSEGYFIAVFLYVNGPTMKDRLKYDGRFNEKEVVAIGTTLCTVLSFLNQQGIYYCDLKPENVMLENGIPKLVDFGNARKAAPNEAVLIGKFENRGTKGYAAPEQYHVGDYIDSRTDVYGFGATLYTLVTGEKGKIQKDGLHAALKAPVSEGLNYIINKCTKADPNERYQTMAEVKRDLSQVENLNSEYTKKLKKRVMIFLSLCLAAILSFIMIFVSYGLYKKQNTSEYNEHYSNAKIYERHGETNKAESEYLLAIQADPKNQKTYEDLYNLMLPSGTNGLERKTEAAIDIIKNNTTIDQLVKNKSLSMKIAKDALNLNDPVYAEYAEKILSHFKDDRRASCLYLIAQTENKGKITDKRKLRDTLDQFYDQTRRSGVSDTQKANDYYLLLSVYNFYPELIDGNGQNFNEIVGNEEALINKNKTNKKFKFYKSSSFYQIAANRYVALGMSTQGKNRESFYKQALKWYSKLDLTTSSISSSTYISQGNLYRELGDKNNALKTYNKAIKVNPNNLEALIPACGTAIETGDKAQAQHLYDQIQNIVNDNPDQSAAILSQIKSLQVQLGL